MGAAAGAAADGVIKGRPEIVEAANMAVVDIKAAEVDIKAVAAAEDIKVAAAAVDIKAVVAVVDIKAAAAVVDIKAAAAVVIKAAAEVKLELKFLSDFLKAKCSNKFRKIACKFS